MQRAAILALISLATAANAQMGETKAELAHRYGPAMPWERMLTSEYGDLVDDACRFEHDGLKTLASFKRGKAGLLIYQKLDKSAMSKKEVSRPWRAQFTSRIGCSSLATVRIPAGAPATLRYSRIIFRKPEFDGAPARLMRVQTAQLDRIYRKIRGEKPYEPSKT